MPTDRSAPNPDNSVEKAFSAQCPADLQAEMELATIYDHAPIAMFVVNSERRVVKLNRTALQMAGLTVEEAVGRLGGELFHCQHAEEGCGVTEACRECLINQRVLETLNYGDSNKNITATLTVLTDQGPSVKYLRISSAPFQYHGEAAAMVFIEDISDLEEKKRQSEASETQTLGLYRQFETLLNAIDDPICLLNRQFELLWANQGYRELQNLLGCDENGLVFKRYFDGMGHYPVADCFNSGATITVDIRTDDQRIWQMRTFPVMEGEQVGQVLLVATDFSEKQQLQEEAVRSSRLASLGLLATGIAHEINNPNAFVLYNSDMLQGVFADLLPDLKSVMAERDGEYNGLQWEELEAELPQMLQAIQEGALRIKRIVGDLRDYARCESNGDFTLVDLNEVAQAAARMVDNPLKQSTAGFYLELAEELPACNGDFGRLEQVVINLLLNSCQALTDTSQRIWLKTFHDPAAAELVLQVVDEGHGVEASLLKSITEPFTTTKGSSGGSGLGLSVSSQIVKEHGGRLLFESQPGQGTSVSLRLPVQEGEG